MKTLLTLFINFLLLIPFAGIAQNAHFINLERKDGLASNFVRTMYQDSFGYMWFGTDDGLNRYDGVHIDTYRHIKKDASSLNNNYIIDILQTSKGKLLICTIDGVDVFNYKTEKFKHVSFSEHYNFKGILETSNNEIWILTKNNTIVVLNSNLQPTNKIRLSDIKTNHQQFKNSIDVFKYDKNNVVLHVENEGFYLLNLNSTKTSFLAKDIVPISTQILKIIAIDKSEFWILSLSGVFVVKNGILSARYTEGDTKEGLNLTSNFILDFKIMPNKEYWLFTDGGGINIYNTETKKFRYIVNDLNSNYSLASNFIYTAYIDKNSSLWLGTVKNGVSQLDKENPFSTYKLIITENNQKFNIPITSLFLDSSNRIWVGSDGKGLYKFDNNMLKFVFYDKTIKTITSINEINNNTLILGTYKNGVSTYDVSNHKIVNQKYINNKLNLDSKITFIEKTNNTFWIGGNKIIKCLALPKNAFIKPDISFQDNNIRALCFEKRSEDTTLFGNYVGFYQHSNKKFKELLHTGQKVNGISKFNQNEYWLATNKGLIFYNTKTNNSQLYGTESGLLNENINSISNYKHNQLWLGTSQGISSFNIKTKTFTNYSYKDGFIDNSFKSLKSLKLANGRLIFGGEKGLLMFHPDSIKTKTKVNNVVFTKLSVNHKNLDPNESKIINGPIENSKLITLNHQQKVFTIGFTSFNFKYTNNIKFSYKLEGYNNEWSTTKERSLTFMNLEPGTYTLKVKASSLSGLWKNSYASIDINILPAWWQTLWFKALIIILMIIALFTINKAILNRERLKREFEFEKKSLKDQKELDEQQLQFFTNLSHEIRTPLSLILSPVETLIQQTTSQNIKNNLHLIQKNASRINRLINRGIDFRKTQFKEPDIQIAQEDIIHFLKELVGSFEEFSMSKNIKLKFISEIDKLPLWFDKYMVETIFYNLLSNAFKYSDTNGEIVLKICSTKKHVNITIQDFGQGISSEDLPYIFERFYQSKNHIGGSGIGLALCKSFVNAHKGYIKVDSSLKNGSTFKVTFHLGNKHFNKKDLVELNKENKAILIENKTIKNDTFYDIKLKNKIILIVEDQTDLRDYLYKNLSNSYIIKTAENGLQAMEIIEKEKIHLVVTDVTMPLMDGMELCKQLKENIKTCDLPIVLLTAKTLNEEKVEGYNTGADVYLEKPFSLNLLKSIINNLLHKKVRLNNKVINNLEIPIDSETINTSDEKFYEQTIAIIEKHIDDIDFNVTKFSKELGMSKSLIYNKMANITNMSINNLILTVRLNKASQMLIYTKKSIVEISLLVGFQNAKYFSTSFKKKFGKTPSKYREENNYLNET